MDLVRRNYNGIIERLTQRRQADLVNDIEQLNERRYVGLATRNLDIKRLSERGKHRLASYTSALCH